MGENQTAIISCWNERKSLVHLITVPITWRRERGWSITYDISPIRSLREAFVDSWSHYGVIIEHHLQSGTMCCVENMTSTMIHWTWSGSQTPKFLLHQFSFFYKKVATITNASANIYSRYRICLRLQHEGENVLNLVSGEITINVDRS